MSEQDIMMEDVLFDDYGEITWEPEEEGEVVELPVTKSGSGGDGFGASGGFSRMLFTGTGDSFSPRIQQPKQQAVVKISKEEQNTP